jgi:hypothetical protein
MRECAGHNRAVADIRGVLVTVEEELVVGVACRLGTASEVFSRYMLLYNRMPGRLRPLAPRH